MDQEVTKDSRFVKYLSRNRSQTPPTFPEPTESVQRDWMERNKKSFKPFYYMATTQIEQQRNKKAFFEKKKLCIAQLIPRV